MGLPVWPFDKDIKTISDMIDAQKDRVGIEKTFEPRNRFETRCPYCGSVDIYSANWAPDKCRGCGALNVDGEKEDWYFDSKEDMELAKRIIARRDKPGNEELDFDGFFEQLELEKKEKQYATGGLVATTSTISPTQIDLSLSTKEELANMQEAFRRMGGAGIDGAKAGVALRKSMEALKLADANDGEIVERETISHYTYRNGYREKDMEVDVNTGKVVWESDTRKAEQAKALEPKEPTKRAIDI